MREDCRCAQSQPEDEPNKLNPLRLTRSNLSGGASLKENVAEFTARRADRLTHVIGFIVAVSFSFPAIADPLDLDTTFNSTGKVVTNFQLDPQDARDIGRDIAVQQDGKIVAVGVAFNGNQSYDFALARYKPNGSIDQGLVHT